MLIIKLMLTGVLLVLLGNTFGSFFLVVLGVAVFLGAVVYDLFHRDWTGKFKK